MTYIKLDLDCVDISVNTNKEILVKYEPNCTNSKFCTKKLCSA